MALPVLSDQVIVARPTAGQLDMGDVVTKEAAERPKRILTREQWNLVAWIFEEPEIEEKKTA